MGRKSKNQWSEVEKSCQAAWKQMPLKDKIRIYRKIAENPIVDRASAGNQLVAELGFVGCGEKFKTALMVNLKTLLNKIQEQLEWARGEGRREAAKRKVAAETPFNELPENVQEVVQREAGLLKMIPAQYWERQQRLVKEQLGRFEDAITEREQTAALASVREDGFWWPEASSVASVTKPFSMEGFVGPDADFDFFGAIYESIGGSDEGDEQEEE